MFTINQNLLYGKQIPAEKHISDSQMFKKLSCAGDARKVPVYGKFLYIQQSWADLSQTQQNYSLAYMLQKA